VGTCGERGGDPHRGHPRLLRVVADPELPVTHVCVRTLRAIEMAEHGLELAHHGRPAAPCAHILFLLA
jgi:hypothetical protein